MGGKTNSQNSCIWNELQNKRGPRPWNRANFSIWRTRRMRNVTITAHTHTHRRQTSTQNSNPTMSKRGCYFSWQRYIEHTSVCVYVCVFVGLHDVCFTNDA